MLFGAFSCDPLFFYEAVEKSTDDYIYIIDFKTNVALISENMYQDFELPGRLVSDLPGQWEKLIHEKDKKRFLTAMDMMVYGETDEHQIEYQVRNRRNEYVWAFCRGILRRDEAATKAWWRVIRP